MALMRTVSMPIWVERSRTALSEVTTAPVRAKTFSRMVTSSVPSLQTFRWKVSSSRE